ncbi:MAG: hypothetical protein DMG65_26375 [Candidatus Angelobacter sp. Gp1-AA117]|nr:MAG: hypothetical protein DMG65_26375 [Candidatus Angelobacter sp. Gp1-AA117]
MRSQDVFNANRNIDNRFMLCQVVAVSARRLQIGSRHYSEIISHSLKLVADQRQHENKAGKAASSEVLLPDESLKAT